MQLTLPTAPPRPARRDGRPLYYALPDGPGAVRCFFCDANGLHLNHLPRNTVWNDPANSPGEAGAVYTVCIHHLPANAVIYDRVKDRCFDKTGASVDS